MKFIILLLFFTTVSRCQNKINDEKNILELEISGLRDYYLNKPSIRTFENDSMFIVKDVMIPDHHQSQLKQHLLIGRELTQAEADEIFGTGGFTFEGAICITQWSHSLLGNGKIILYDEDVRKRYLGKLGSPNPIALSCPLIRNDGKFALIQMSGRTLGGLLHIYKKENGEWILYKEITMFLT